MTKIILANQSDTCQRGDTAPADGLATPHPDRRRVLGWMVASSLTPAALSACGGGDAAPSNASGFTAAATGAATRQTAQAVTAAAAALPTKMINVGPSRYYQPGSHKTIDIAPLHTDLSGKFDAKGRVTLQPGESLSVYICLDADKPSGAAAPGRWVASSHPSLTVNISPSATVSRIKAVRASRSQCVWKGYGLVLLNLTNQTAIPFSGDPDLRFFPKSEESRMKAGAILQTAARDDLSKNGVLRFLGDMSINNSVISAASQIASSEHAYWNGNMPPEVIGKIGTEANADVWVPSYHLMSPAEMQAYDQRLASTFKTGRVWREYSNETWDGIQAQMHYMVEFFDKNNLLCYDYDGNLVTDKAQQTDWLKNRAAYAQCCLDAWRAAESVFGKDRVVRIFGGWSAVFDLMKPALQYIDPLSGKRLWQIMNDDAGRSFVGIAPYFGTIYSTPEQRAARGCTTAQVNDMSHETQIRDQYWTGPNGGAASYKKAVLAGIDQAQAWVRNCKAVLAAMGATNLKLVAYENGADEFSQMSMQDQGTSCGCVVNYSTNTLEVAGNNVTSFARDFSDGDQISWSYASSSTYPALTTDPWNAAWAPQNIFVKVVSGGTQLELYNSAKARINLNTGLDGVMFGVLNATRYWRHANFVFNQFFNQADGLDVYKTYHAMLDAEGLVLRTQFTNVGGTDYSDIHSLGRDLGFWGMKRGYTDPDTPRSAWFNALPK